MTHRPPTFLNIGLLPRLYLQLNWNRPLHRLLRQLSSAFDTSRKEFSSPSDSDSDRPLLDIFPEEGELSEDQEANLSDRDQSLSEEQSYRETMRGIQSYMGWNHIPDIDSGATTPEDNPFAGPKLHTPGKVSVNLPTDEWLCKKCQD